MNMQKSPDRSPAISFSYNLLNSRNLFSGGGGGGYSLQEANRDVPLDGVAFSRLDWL